MQKLKIKNRKGQSAVVLIESNENPRGLAFVMHGLSGNKDQPHIKTYAEAFKEKGFTVVSFDTTNTFGESDGDYVEATVTNYLEDLEDIINWSETQSWYQEPFYLAGHSLGGICITLYAEKFPEKVKALAPTSTVVSGKLSTETEHYINVMENWEKTGWLEQKSATIPGLIKKLKWSHMADRMKYDLLPEAHKLTMPVLMIVGDRDESTPYEHQKLLYDKLPGEKEMHIIKGSKHTFVKPEHLGEIKKIFLEWIEKVETI